jgi:hypothetical protein
MSTINDGGPAFPSALGNYTDEAGRSILVDSQDRCLEGMSLRDYFAAKALQGTVHILDDLTFLSDESEDRAIAHVAAGCYKVADAMLAARQPKAVQG